MNEYLDELVTDPINLTLDKLDVDLFISLLKTHIESTREYSYELERKLNSLTGVDRTMAYNSFQGSLRSIDMRLNLLMYLQEVSYENSRSHQQSEKEG